MIPIIYTNVKSLLYKVINLHTYTYKIIDLIQRKNYKNSCIVLSPLFEVH